MTPEEHEQKTADLRVELSSQIFALYPVGSRWYSPQQDDGVVVVAHFEPRGIICRSEGSSTPGEPSYTIFSFGELLDGSVIVPRVFGAVFEYQERRKLEDQQYDDLMKTLPAGRMWK